MGWLWFLGVIAVIFALLACPVVLYIRYDENIDVKGRYLFITYSLTDKKDESVKKEAKKSVREDKPEQKAKPAPKKKKSAFAQMTEEDGVSGFLSFITDLAAVACGSLANLFKHCNLSRFRIFVKLAGGDSADTAKLYGEVCAVLMPLSSFVLGRFRHERNASVRVEPDFLGGDTRIFTDIRCRISLFFIIREAVSALIKIISARVKNNIKNTGGVEHGRTCN